MISFSALVRAFALATLLVLEGSYRGSDAQQNASLSSLAAMERSVHTQINQYRVSRGLTALTLDSRISAQARMHSQAMANGKARFSHDGFDARVNAVSRDILYSSAAENVSYSRGYRDPASIAVSGWLKSPGHLKNIQGAYGAKGLTGIGATKNARGEVYFTQIFIQPR